IRETSRLTASDFSFKNRPRTPGPAGTDLAQAEDEALTTYRRSGDIHANPSAVLLHVYCAARAALSLRFLVRDTGLVDEVGYHSAHRKRRGSQTPLSDG